MERKGIERFAPLTGVLFLVVVVASLIVGGEGPTTDDSLQETVDFWRDDETNQIISAVLGAYAAGLLVWFAASVRDAVARAEPDTGRLASISFAGAVIVAAGALFTGALEFTLAEAADEMSPQGLHALSILYSDMWFPFAIGLALFLFPAGLAAVRYGAFDRWLGWMAIVIGFVCATPLGFFGFLAALAWTGLAGVVLYRIKDPVGSGAAPPPAPASSIEVPPGAGPPSP